MKQSKNTRILQIAADKNILFAKKAFSTLGEVKLLEQKDITNENIRDFDALIVRSTTKIDEKLLSGTNIKFVGSTVGGVDHIDEEYLQKAGIALSTATGCNSRSVVEYVLTAIYSFCKYREVLPKDMTVGIVGVGNIGGHLAEILKNLGIKTILNDPLREKNGESGFSSLDFLAKNSDIVTIHVPLTKSGEHKTQNLIGEDFFAKMKDSSILIQTSRGDVCDEKAFVKASKIWKKPLAEMPKFYIDVWQNEPNVNADFVKICSIRTPHIAGHSFDGKINGTKMIYEACCAHFSKKTKFDFESEVFSKIKKQIIKYEKDDVYSTRDILQDCCPTVWDSLYFAVNFLNQKKAEDRKKTFREVRQDYPKRLEFKHFKIKNAPEEIKDELKTLGFNLSK